MSRSHELIGKIICKEKYTEIYRVFADKKYAVVKGEALSLYAYDAPNMRQSSDVDILIPRMFLRDVEDSLRNNSFENEYLSRRDEVLLLSSSHQTLPWNKYLYPWGNLTVDLNFDIFWGEYEGKRVDIEGFLSDTVDIDIYGVKVKTLPPLKAMVQLILHHYKDMNSIYLLAARKSINRNMFKDVYYLLMNNLEDISIDRLYAISSEYGIIPYVFYVLYYTNRIYSDATLGRYVETFRTREGERLLNLYGLCEKERREWHVDFNTRLEAESAFPLIEKDLTDRDKKKIEINKKFFAGGSDGQAEN